MWVAKQMGHSDWTLVARVYSGWMPDTYEISGSKAELKWAPEPDYRGTDYV